MQKADHVPRDARVVRQDVEWNGRVRRELLEVDESDDSGESQDEGDEYLVAGPGVCHASPS